jgi:hypothetical protein
VAPWQQIAQLGNGRYLKVAQSGGAFAVTTPFDDELAQLSARLDDTRLFYGNADQMNELNAKVAATERLQEIATTGSRVRRAVFNATESGHKNLFGDQDLVDDIGKGEVSLDSVPEEELPASFRELDRAERERVIGELAESRNQLQQRIDELTRFRSSFIDERVEAEGGAADSLDRQLYDAVREQAAPAGLRFERGPEF